MGLDIRGCLSGANVNYAQVVIVAKSGGDFTTIQAAIDSITDATTTKRYVIKVQSGIYSEAVTCKDYVDILGAGRTNTIISGTSGTVLTFPATKCTVSEIGIDVNYGTLGAASTAITSAGADSVLKDCDITVTKSGGDFIMNGITITAGSFRMSDCYFTYSDTSGATATRLVQSAIKQTGTVTNVILNNNEVTASTTDTNDDLVGIETTALVTGTCLLSNNIFTVNTNGGGSSATGIWAYGTCSGAIFNQNRLTVNCNSTAYGVWVDSTAGGAVIDTRHNEIIVTSAASAYSAEVAAGDTWNSTFDKITAASGYSGLGTINFVSSYIDGEFSTNGDVGIGTATPDDKLQVNTTTASKGAHIGYAFVGNYSAGAVASFSYFGNNNATDYALIQSAANTFLNAKAGNSITFALGGVAKGIMNSGGDFNFYGTGDVNLFYTDFSDDKVGIGTATPATKLDVNGTVKATGFQLAGDMEVLENAIELDAALSADGTYSGIAEPGTAGAALAFGDLCYLQTADSRWELADANAVATSGSKKLGICILAAVGDGSATRMLLWGKVRADTAFPALTIGDPVYVGTVAGDVVTTAPGSGNVVRIIGYGNTADELHFCPDNSWVEVA